MKIDPSIEFPKKYEKPQVRRHTQLLAISPAGCKLGHSALPIRGWRNISKEQHVSVKCEQ